MSRRLGIHLPEYSSKNGDKIKAFSFKLIGTKKNFDSLMKDAGTLIRHTEAPNVTRVMIRAFIESSLVKRIKERAEKPNGFSIEASFPVDHVFEGYDLVTLGHNEPSRTSDLEARARYLEQTVRINLDCPVPEIKELVQKCEGYITEQYTHMEIELATQISTRFTRIFYKYPTDISPEAVMQMPKDHIVLVARKSGSDEIAAVFMADKETAVVEGKEITFMNFVNVDANKAIALDIIPLMAYKTIYIAINTKGPNLVVFAEAFADSPILQRCCRLAGMNWAGTLEQTSLFGIRGRDSEPSYKDRQVWYIPSEYYSKIFRKPTQVEIDGGVELEKRVKKSRKTPTPKQA